MANEFVPVGQGIIPDLPRICGGVGSFVPPQSQAPRQHRQTWHGAVSNVVPPAVPRL